VTETLYRDEKILLIDACGETAGVAVCEGASVRAAEDLPRAGSAEIVLAVERVLRSAGWGLKELDAVGVVSGPGSFTGVRVGMAAAKGFCEAHGTRMIAVSRLEVLAEAVGLTDGVLALDAGRGEFYLYERTSDGGREWLGTVDDVLAMPDERTLVVTEAKGAAALAVRRPVVHALHVGDALGVVLRMYRSGAETMVLSDGNYVRREGDIYSKPTPKKVRVEA
jgi:tRNA threonylcarbamoyladenosine biosynthesis protein TsaB